MAIAPSEIREIAAELGNDERDAKRIENAATSFNGVYSRDDKSIVKNGMHNMCRYYVLAHGKFAPWLAKVLPTDYPIGIYIAKKGTPRWEIHDRMAIAADTGNIPRDIHVAAVIRTSESDEALMYAERAEKMGAKFVLIHDESGKRDEMAMLASSDIEKLDITEEISEHGKFIRYTGDVPIERRIVDIYKRNAANVCLHIMESRLSAMLDIRDRQNVPDVPVPTDILSIMSCGRREGELSLKTYRETRDCIAAAATSENASYNTPYDKYDRRAFAFVDTDSMIELFNEHSTILDELIDLQEIWRYASELAGKNGASGGELWAVRSLYKDVLGEKSARSRIAKRKKMSKEYGIDSMVDSYYAGVPVEDICA